ncbi:MAG TPA: hypothetical protein K8V41_02165 [Ligilactobacillus saerimneri]|nr:hypothetical protein [Ligilactobacillus saerimneri]
MKPVKWEPINKKKLIVCSGYCLVEFVASLVFLFAYTTRPTITDLFCYTGIIMMILWWPTIVTINVIEKRNGGMLFSYELIESWRKKTIKEKVITIVICIIILILIPPVLFVLMYIYGMIEKLLDFFVQLVFWGIFFGIAGFIMLIGKIFHL